MSQYKKLSQREHIRDASMEMYIGLREPKSYIETSYIIFIIMYV